MNEHEKFKDIISQIGYEVEYPFDESQRIYIREDQYYADVLNPVLMIFTDKFQKCIYDYCDNTPGIGIMEYDVRMFSSRLMENLHRPVEFIHEFIFPKKYQK